MYEANVLIKALKAAMNGTKITVPDVCDVDKLFDIAKAHDVAGMVCYGLDGEGLEKFKQEQNAGMRKYFVQSAELDVLCDLFERNGIYHMPLKGSVIRDIYPSPDMRTSGDIDILTKPEEKEKIHVMMISEGYEKYKVDTNVVTYVKKPIVCVEMHRELHPHHKGLPESLLPGYDGYVRADGTRYRYYMNNEDLFEYLIWHFAKHVADGGAGIRNVIDVYLFEKKRTFDRDKVNANLERHGLMKFYTLVKKLCDVWFEDASADDDVIRLGKYVLNAGVYGTEKNSMASARASGQSKFKRLVRRVFPTVNDIKCNYPILVDKPALIPLFYVIRPIQKLFSPLAIKAEIDRVQSASDDDVDEMKKMLDSLGIKKHI